MCDAVYVRNTRNKPNEANSQHEWEIMKDTNGNWDNIEKEANIHFSKWFSTEWRSFYYFVWLCHVADIEHRRHTKHIFVAMRFFYHCPSIIPRITFTSLFSNGVLDCFNFSLCRKAWLQFFHLDGTSQRETVVLVVSYSALASFACTQNMDRKLHSMCNLR